MRAKADLTCGNVGGNPAAKIYIDLNEKQAGYYDGAESATVVPLARCTDWESVKMVTCVFEDSEQKLSIFFNRTKLTASVSVDGGEQLAAERCIATPEFDEE